MGAINLDDSFNIFEILQYGIQYLSKNMKCKFGNMGSIPIQKHEMTHWYCIWDQYLSISIKKHVMANWYFQFHELKHLKNGLFSIEGN